MINTWGKSLRLYSGVGLSCKDVTHGCRVLQAKWNKERSLAFVYWQVRMYFLQMDRYRDIQTKEMRKSCYDQKYHKQVRIEVISMDMRLIPLESFT